MMAMLLATVDIPDMQWGENMYSLAFCIGRQHQLQIKGNELRDAIQAVTDADIQHLAKTIFAPEKRATVIVELEGHSTHNLKVGACASQTTTIPKRLTYVVSTGAAKPAQF